jgi:hypothetical protein
MNPRSGRSHNATVSGADRRKVWYPELPHLSRIATEIYEVLTAIIMKEFYLLGYNAIYSVDKQLTFRRNLARNERETGSTRSFSLSRASFLLGLIFDPEDGGDMFLRNVG